MWWGAIVEVKINGFEVRRKLGVLGARQRLNVDDSRLGPVEQLRISINYDVSMKDWTLADALMRRGKVSTFFVTSVNDPYRSPFSQPNTLCTAGGGSLQRVNAYLGLDCGTNSGRAAV